MSRYSHQYLVAVTVETNHAAECVTEKEMISALARRLGDVIEHDGVEAFSLNDTDDDYALV